jgi:hypothetical protein
MRLPAEINLTQKIPDLQESGKRNIHKTSGFFFGSDPYAKLTLRSYFLYLDVTQNYLKEGLWNPSFFTPIKVLPASRWWRPERLPLPRSTGAGD